MRFSPQGDRIAWVLTVSETPPFNNVLGRLFPSSAMQNQEILGIWVSQIDGSKMHEVGHIKKPLRPFNDNTETDNLDDIEWLPDGRHLSFVYKDTLWMIEAD